MLALPSPLHPLFVHLPIALTLLVPAFAIGALVAIRRGTQPRRAWGITVALLALLTSSAWVALQTGEREEEFVEDVVAEAAIERHEEAADAFLLATAVVFLVGIAGLATGRPGAAARVTATVGSLLLVGAGWQVGHSGGDLAYREGAAVAYTASRGGGDVTSSTAGASAPRTNRKRDDEPN